MEEIRLNHTILKSTNSGGYAALTKEFLLNFGFTVSSSKIVSYNYNNSGAKIVIYINIDGSFDMFTEHVFLCKGYVVKNDWYHPKTIKEFLDIFNEYKTYIQHNS